VVLHRKGAGPDFCQLSGDDPLALAGYPLGQVGCISVTANVAPRLCAEFQNACLKGDYKTALTLQDRLMPLHDALFVETNPGPVKYAVWRLGVVNSSEVRLPLAPASEAAMKTVDAALAQVGLLQAKAAE